MTYGDDKVRDMCRSILPSTRRKSDRQNAEKVRRRNRRLTRQTLHDWRMAADVDDFEGHVFCYEDSAACGNDWNPWSGQASIKAVMWGRREHDKLAPMIRWAVKITSHIEDPADRQEYMRRILPDNLIGRHAMSHLRFLDEFDTDMRIDYSWQRRNEGPMLADEVEARVRELITTDHKRLNRLLKNSLTWVVRRGKYVKVEIPIVHHDHDEAFFTWARTYTGRQTLEKIFDKLA